MNLPNKLSILRIILVPIMVAIFYIKSIPYNYVISAGIFIIASLTDYLDGYLARKYNLITDLGKFLDSIADKVLVLTALTIMLTEPKILIGSFGYDFYRIVGGVGVAIIVAREIMVCFLRMMAATKGLVLAAENVGKIKTFVTDISIVLLLLATKITALYAIGAILFVISVVLTIYSGVYYVIKNKGVFK